MKKIIFFGMIVLILNIFLVYGASYPIMEKLDCKNGEPIYDRSYGEWKCPVLIISPGYSTPQENFEPFCIEQYCPDADPSLCICTKMEYPSHPIAANLDDNVVDEVVITITTDESKSFASGSARLYFNDELNERINKQAE